MSGLSPEEYSARDGLALGELVKRGDVTAAEVVEAAIEAIERVNGPLNAVVVRDFERARKAAQGPLPEGAFQGVPLLIKDLDVPVAGLPLTLGSRLFRDVVADADGTLVERFRRAGVVVLGKSNAPELGLTPVTESALWGPARTPWSLAHTSGGSSGGAAAAVASGMVPLAHASDGGGSIRIPASCCGLFGLKPSRGRTPVGPNRSEAWSGLAIDHVLSRSVRDSAAMLDAVAAPDPDSVYGCAAPARPWLAEVSTPPGRLRIGVCKTPFLPGTLHADCAAAVDAAAALLSELGHEVEPVELGVDRGAFARSFFRHVCVETAATLALWPPRLLGRKARRRDVETSTWLCAMIGRRVPGPAVSLTREELWSVARRVLRASARFDLLLTPTLGMPPVRIGALAPHGAEARLQELVATLGLGWVLDLPPITRATLERIFAFMPYTPLANVTGQPSMTLPLHWNREGLPVGVMLTGRPADEATLFRVAGQLESARPWAARRPPVHASAPRAAAPSP